MLSLAKNRYRIRYFPRCPCLVPLRVLVGHCRSGGHGLLVDLDSPFAGQELLHQAALEGLILLPLDLCQPDFFLRCVKGFIYGTLLR